MWSVISMWEDEPPVVGDYNGPGGGASCGSSGHATRWPGGLCRSMLIRF